MAIVRWLIAWIERNYGFVLSLILLTLGFLLWVELNPRILKPAQGVVRLYFADNISPAHLAVIQAYNRAREGRVEIVPVNLPFEKFSTNERKELLTRALRSRSNRLDIFAVDQIWVSRFAKWAEPLDDYFGLQERQDLMTHALASCLYEEHLVGLPLYIDVGILYYRRDLLQRLPDFAKVEKRLQHSISWEEFIRLGSRPELASLPFYLFPADPYEGLMCSFIENMASQNRLAVEPGHFDLTSAEAERSLQLMVDLIAARHLAPPVITTFKEVDLYVYAFKNDALFFRGWPGNMKTYRDDFPDKVAQVGMAALPHFQDGAPAYSFGGWNLMVSKFSSRKIEAIDFIRFVLTRESQERLYEIMGYLPSNESVYADSAFVGKNPELRYLHSLLENGVRRPALSDYTRLSDIVTSSLNQALRGEVGVAQALTTAKQRVAGIVRP